MRISGPSASTRVSAARRESRKSNGGGSFAIDGGGTAPVQAPGGMHALAPMDALVALQEVPDAAARKRRAIKRGEQMLDLLEEIKIGLLSGGLSRARLTRLSRLLADGREALENPNLDGVLDEIDLRAQVELAKLERAA